MCVQTLSNWLKTPHILFCAAALSIFVGSFFSLPVNSIDRINIGGALLPVLYALVLAVVYCKELIPILVSVVGCIVVGCSLSHVTDTGLGVDPLAMAVFSTVLVFLVTRINAPIVVYIATTLGLFVGSDLLHMHELGNQSGGVIGGAGMFDGVLDIPLLSVFLTAGIQSWIMIPRERAQTPRRRSVKKPSRKQKAT